MSGTITRCALLWLVFPYPCAVANPRPRLPGGTVSLAMQERILRASLLTSLDVGEDAMPQALLCKRCKQPFVFTGAGIELLPGNRVGYRHSCGAVNELHFLRTDERGRTLYRVVGLIGGSKQHSIPK